MKYPGYTHRKKGRGMQCQYLGYLLTLAWIVSVFLMQATLFKLFTTTAGTGIIAADFRAITNDRLRD